MNEVLTDLGLDADSLVSQVKSHYVKNSDGSEYLVFTDYDSKTPIALFSFGGEGSALVRENLDLFLNTSDEPILEPVP